MIVAVDTSILLDIFQNDPRFVVVSVAALTAARSRGVLVACPVVWAEVAASFSEAATMRSAMHRLGISFDAFDEGSALLAGEIWRDYRRAGGKRERLLADFFVGAHAMARGGRLLSRDSGFYRRYFRGLIVLA